MKRLSSLLVAFALLLWTVAPAAALEPFLLPEAAPSRTAFQLHLARVLAIEQEDSRPEFDPSELRRMIGRDSWRFVQEAAAPDPVAQATPEKNGGGRRQKKHRWLGPVLWGVGVVAVLLVFKSWIDETKKVLEGSA